MMKPEMTKNTSTPASQGRVAIAAKLCAVTPGSSPASCWICSMATARAARARRTWTRGSLDKAGQRLHGAGGNAEVTGSARRRGRQRRRQVLAEGQDLAGIEDVV